MFVHMSIHYPKKGKESLVIESMHTFGNALKTQPGLISVNTLKDEDTGRLIGLAIWESKDHWEAARPIMHESVKDYPFEEWEKQHPDVFHLNEV